MKKLLAMILAMTTAASMAVTAMAETTAEENNQPKTRTVSYDKDKDGVVLHADTVLTPNETYYFPILVTEGGEATAKDMTSDQFKNFKFSFTSEEGKGLVESIKVEKYKSRYSLALKTNTRSITEVSEVAYSVKIIDKTSNEEIASAPLHFQMGYPSLSDNAASNPDFVTVDPKTPVITADQFKELDSEADGGLVTFGHDDWEFAVKVRGMKDTNLISDSDDIDVILEKYPNQEFKFVTFPFGPAFRTEGTLTIDVSDDMNTFDGKFYVYMYDNGRLTLMNSKLDEEKETLTVETKQLGRFVITNKAVTNHVVGSGSGSTGSTGNTGSSNGSTSSGSNGGSNGSTSVPNPSTGAADFTGLALALGTVSLSVLAAKKMK